MTILWKSKHARFLQKIIKSKGEKTMEMENKYASKGVAGAGLGLGIAGTALGLLMNGNGLGGILGCGNKQNFGAADAAAMIGAI